MSFPKQEIQAVYRRRAKRYDFYVKLYRLLGFRYEAYRARAVKRLHLQRGNLVVELGCGTGLNFSPVVEQIGPEGQLIGIDLTPEMLACARERVERSGWTNVELIQSDMTEYEFPEGVNGVLSTGALGYIAEYDRVIEKAMHALVPCGRLSIWDLKRPESWPSWLFNFYFVWLARPFGVTPDYVESHPWESLERYFEETTFEQRYGGAVYISSGTAPSAAD